MKKIWFFVEGDSENSFVVNLIRNKFYDKVLLKEDLLEFINKDIKNLTHNIVYCDNCESVDKIPHKINERYYLIEQSASNDIFVVCDIEKLICATNRKNLIESILNGSIDKDNVKYIFFNPKIEAFYWMCKPIIKKIIELQYKEKFGKKIDRKILIPKNPTNPLHGLKELFKKYDLKYREASFAKELKFRTPKMGLRLIITSFTSNL